MKRHLAECAIGLLAAVIAAQAVARLMEWILK